MPLRRPALVLIVILLTTSAALSQNETLPASGETYTLERCLELARQRSAKLRESREGVEAARARVDAAASSRLPVLDASASYLYNSKVMEHRIEMPGLGGIDLRFGDGHQTDLSLGISVPLYTGGRLVRTVEAERAGLAAAQRQHESAERELERDLRRAFFNVLGQQAQLQVVELGIQRLNRHLEEVRNAVTLGTASQEDELRIRSRLLKSGQSRHRARAAWQAAALGLGHLIGEPGTAVSPAGDLENSQLKGLEPSALEGSQVLRRPELAALEEEIQRQSLFRKAVGSSFRPSLFGDIRGHYGRPGVDLLENEWMSYATARLALTWTIWDAGARGHQQDQLRAQVRRLEARRDETVRAFQTAYASALTLLESATGELTEAKQRVQVESTILTKVALRLELAQASENEYLDAQDDLNEAEFDLTLALTQLRMAEAELLWTLGR